MGGEEGLGRIRPDAERTGQHAFKVNAKNPGIGQIVVAIADPVVAVGLDGPGYRKAAGS